MRERNAEYLAERLFFDLEKQGDFYSPSYEIVTKSATMAGHGARLGNQASTAKLLQQPFAIPPQPEEP